MADFGSALWNKPASGGGTGEGGGAPSSSDPVTRSLRFNRANNSALYIDPTVDHDSSTVFTFSCWAKLGEVGADTYLIFSAGHYPNSANQAFLYFSFNSDCALRVSLRGAADTSTTTYSSTDAGNSGAVFRDPSAWYHLLMVRDGASLKAYVNNSVVISETISATTSYGVGDGLPMHVGSSLKPTSSSIVNYWSFDGLLADVYFTDGYAKSPTDFIESNNYGGYKPKAYTGEFGTNGFHIDAQPAHDADLLVTSVARKDGDTTFADVAKGRDVNVRGTPHHSIAIGNPFTGDDRAIYFDGTDDYLDMPDSTDFTLGSGDFTYECWLNPSSLPTSGSVSVFGQGNSLGQTATGSVGLGYQASVGEMGFSWYDSTNSITYGTTYSGTTGSTRASGTTSVSTNTWYHFAIVRSGATVTMYKDGVSYSSVTLESSSANINDSSHKYSIGRWGEYDGSYFNGYLYDVRFTKGTAVYTGAFTPPTSKLTADATYTKLLVQPDKDDTDFNDESASGHTITTNGSPTRTASTPYDTAAKSSAIRLDSESLITETQMDFAIGSSDTFTAEGWFYLPSSLPAYTPFFSTRHSGAVDGWQLSADSTASYWNFTEYSGSSATDTTVALPSTGEWFHLAIVKNSSSTDGVSVYVNGALKFTATSTSSMTSASSLTIGDYWGAAYSSYYPIDAYVYDIRFSKNEARYSGTSTSDWGNFSEITAPFELNPVYIGGDQSGNKNHFTPTGIIAAHDVLIDNPFKNYPTWNPLVKSSNAFSEGNLKVTTTSSTPAKIVSTIGASSGKWYAELLHTGQDNRPLGITADNRERNYLGNSDGNTSIAFWAGTTATALYINDTSVTWSGSSTTWASGDIIGIALNADDEEVSLYKNGSLVGAAVSYSSYNWTEAFFAAGNYISGLVYHANFGADPTFAGDYTGTPASSEWAYSPPNDSSGNPFKSLNSSNLGTPAVTPTNHFDVLTYNGAYDNYSNFSGTSPQTITGTDFKPEIVWIKDRDNVSSNYGNGYHGGYWFDNVMGTGYALNTDLDNSSHSGSSLASGEDGISSFNSNSELNSGGFTVDEADETNAAADSSYGGSIDTYERYVAWCWKLGKSGSSSTWASGNTDPDTEKYNDSAGVSIIDYYDSVYDGSAITLNHSLGAAPEFAIAFDYEGYTSGHYVWHKDLSSGNYLALSSNSSQSSDTDYFPASPATATTFTLGTSISSGIQSHVALFTSVEGMVKVGSWVGNGYTDGPVVHCGFRPSLILCKAVNRSNSWYMWDDQRDGYNVTDAGLWADLNSAESNAATNKVDILSNGFKLRGSGNGTNSSSSNNYIFIAWAHSPFKHANAR
mgnify:CR=1 FL=1